MTSPVPGLTGEGFCSGCHTPVSDIEILMHAVKCLGAKCWPDGKLALIDTSLEPECFVDDGMREFLQLVRTALRMTRRQRFRAWFKAHTGF